MTAKTLIHRSLASHYDVLQNKYVPHSTRNYISIDALSASNLQSARLAASAKKALSLNTKCASLPSAPPCTNAALSQIRFTTDFHPNCATSYTHLPGRLRPWRRRRRSGTMPSWGRRTRRRGCASAPISYSRISIGSE